MQYIRRERHPARPWRAAPKYAVNLGSGRRISRCGGAAVATVLKGQRYLSPGLEAMHADLLVTDRPIPQSGRLADRLTPRQREVLQMVAAGRTAREIAAVLNPSRKTVEYHKGTIMRALGLRTTAGLTRDALEHGIIGQA